MDYSKRVIHVPRPARVLAYINSRRRPLDIEVETTSHILNAYGLELAGPARNLPVGRRNRNLDVSTSAGRKLLKGYRPQWQVDTVRYAHSIITRLAQLNFPTPRLVSARDGRDYVTSADSHYALFDYVTGINYSGGFLLRSHRRRLMAQAGKTLASFHQELQGFQPEGLHHMGFADYTGQRRRDVAWHVAKVQELAEKSQELTRSEEQRCADWLCRNSNYMLEEIGRLNDVLAQAPLPRLVIHGDFGLHNLLFQEDGTIVVVDFELARLEWRVSDLVSCLSRYRFNKTGQIVYDFASIQAFMDGYQSLYPLSSDEWQLLPQVWRFYKMQSAVQYWNSFFQTSGPVRKLNSARDAISQVDWVRNYPHRLVALNSTPVPALTVVASPPRTFDFGELN